MLPPAWVERLERRLNPPPSEFSPLGLCLEKALANMHVECAARQVELLWGAPSQPKPELAADEKPLPPAAAQAAPSTSGLLKFRGRPTSPHTSS